VRPPRRARAERARLLAEILATYGEVRWHLRRHDLPGVVARLRRPQGRRRRRAPALAEADARRCAHAVVRVLRLLPTDSRCLVRSLVLLAVLARRDARAELVIGVMPGPRFAAHAWLELQGVPLLNAGPAAAGRLVEL